jgi:hypothetical protein
MAVPARRLRFSARKVKSSPSRHHFRDNDPYRPAVSTAITAIDIAMHTSPPKTAQRRPHRANPSRPRPPQSHTRRHKVVQLMTADPDRRWTGKDHAHHLQVPTRNMLTQLAE